MTMTRVWLLTGASRGLGRAIAETVLAAGDRLQAGARDPRTLADLAARYPETLRIATLDVTDPAAGEAAVQAALHAWGRVDVLVNNAGYGHLMPFEQMDAADFRDQVETNFFGVVNLTRAVVPVMRRQRSGHIFQVSSVGGRIGHPGLSAYQAAKWAVGGFSEVLAQELAPLGIRVTALEPGGGFRHPRGAAGLPGSVKRLP
jgi:NAD(P)-dependent dehydrogenase (short-subunit alcohol dehydrogenase family)